MIIHPWGKPPWEKIGENMKKIKMIGVLIGDTPTFHIPVNGGSDYDTQCGIDAHDKAIGHNGTIKVPKGQKIDCTECRFIWENIIDLNLKKSDFVK